MLLQLFLPYTLGVVITTPKPGSKGKNGTVGPSNHSPTSKNMSWRRRPQPRPTTQLEQILPEHILLHNWEELFNLELNEVGTY